MAFNFFKKKKKDDPDELIRALEKMLAEGDDLQFVMKVASDSGRGRNNPEEIKSAALKLISSEDDDIAFFAIDACAVRMHLSESFPEIISRLSKSNSVEVLYSMTSGLGVLGRRNLIERKLIIDAIDKVRKLVLIEKDNEEALKNCDDFLEELSGKGSESV